MPSPKPKTKAKSTSKSKSKSKSKKKSKAQKRPLVSTSLSSKALLVTAAPLKKKRARVQKAPAAGLPEVLSCGLLLRQRRPTDAVLALLRADGSPDLPKGHLKRGESDLDAALREFEEETGISRTRIAVFGDRTFESCYRTRSKKTGRLVNKTVRVFLAEIDGPATVSVVDHRDYAWLPIGDAVALERSLRDNPTFLGAVQTLLSS